MGDRHTLRIVLTALFAALVCVATMIIRIPSPTGGYINAGDAIALLSAFLLGPYWGAAAAGLGSMLADLLAGYPAYAPGTLVIKAATALVAGLIARKLPARPAAGRLLGGLCGELIMVLGYLGYTAVCLGYGVGALPEVPGNLAQGAFGIIASALLARGLLRSREVRELLEKFR